MPSIPNSNITGLPVITKADLKNADPARLNRVLRLIASQIHGVQTGVPSSTTITNITQDINNSGGGSSSGGGSTASTTVTLQGTHIERLADFLPGNYPAGVQFYETDRTVLYLNFISPSTVQVWQWISGTMRAAYASIPGDLGQYDTGFLFEATDLELTYIWNGSAWVVLSNVEPVLQDTHANRLLNFPSTTYPASTLFWETDRTVLYINQNATGTVTPTGSTTVPWISGDKFDTSTNWIGKPITINGVIYIIASVTNATHLVTTVAVTAGIGVAYSIASGKWQYATGTYSVSQASLPADLLTSDNGFEANVIGAFQHTLTWSGASAIWTWGPGESGSGYVQSFAIDPSPTTGWKLCDGSATSYLKSDGTTASYTTPDIVGNPAYLKLGSPYTGTINPPVAPLITGTTDAAATGDDVSVSVGSAGSTGPPVAVVNGVSFLPATHTHGLSGTTVDTNGEPQNIILRPWFRR